MVYLVSCDLNKEKDYPKLIDAISRYANPSHVLQSQWVVCSEKSAEEIFNELVNFVDADDELFVCEINENYSGTLK